MKSTGEEATGQKAVSSISIEIKTPKRTTSIQRRNSYPRKKEDVTSSRVQETLEDKRSVYKNKFSLDREFNDQRVLHDDVASTADLVKTRKPPISNKLKIRLPRRQEIRDYHEGRVHGDQVESKRKIVSPNSTPIGSEGGGSEKVADQTSSLSGRNVKGGRRGRSALQVPVAVAEAEVREDDEDMIKAAETLLMMRRDRRSMAESTGRNSKCLGFDLNEPPPMSPEDEANRGLISATMRCDSKLLFR
ncbi:unnamed protein product [Lactuca virosa]|uniref:Uncharacterized protein n=1 Tax=Lactuca virosa TaxID=75947 RepID=A0AAU9N4F4_9ASTR|nr:unnamed protein product [Lactuca virosa]